MEHFLDQLQNPGPCIAVLAHANHSEVFVDWDRQQWQLLLFNDKLWKWIALYSMYCVIICPFLSRSDHKSMMLFAILRAAVSDPEKNVSSIPADLGPRERKQLEFYNTRYSVCEQVWSWKNKATSQRLQISLIRLYFCWGALYCCKTSLSLACFLYDHASKEMETAKF